MTESELIQIVINLLENEPENWTAKWFTGKTIDKSVKYKGKELYVYCDGSILQPVTIMPSESDKKIICDLIKPLFDRDKQYILDTIF